MNLNKIKAIVSVSAVLALTACTQMKVKESETLKANDSYEQSQNGGYVDNEYSYLTVNDGYVEDGAYDVLTEGGFQYFDQVTDVDKDKVAKNNVILFHFDSSELSYEMIEVINEHISFLMRNPNVKVILEGHTDERGSDSYNLVLGEKRANAVKDYMLSNGIQVEQVEVISLGELMPVVNESNEAAWAQNRRAVFKYK